MGIFSFGKKDDASTRRGATTSSSRAARSERVERRTRRTERSVDADAMLLDPTLPEKQRARRRLVGAIALVVAAVIVLPMVLDSHPKPVTDDIAIDIPSRPAPKLASKAPEDTQAGVAPDNPAADAGLAASSLTAASATTSAAAAANQPKSAAHQASQQAAQQAAPSTQAAAQANAQTSAKPATKPTATANATAPTAQSRQSAATTAATNRSTPNARTATDDESSGTPKTNGTSVANAATNAPANADANSGTPAAPAGSRFAVQLGAFSNGANARNWAAKLKAAGVPAYTELRKQPDGSTLTLLRAGPFADRAAATEAIAKVRGAGLMAGATNGPAQ